MTLTNLDKQRNVDMMSLSTKVWIYTNYDCNLRCTYCVAESHPRAPKRAIPRTTVERIIDEAVELSFESVYFTGGEPFILDEIYSMLVYATDRLSTTILTNAMLFNERRLQKLVEINHPNLQLQISLDGSRPAHHDPYRGP